MRFSLLTLCILACICNGFAQYQDGGYENNVNPYPRAQYNDGGESYSRQPTSYGRANIQPSSYSKPKAASNKLKAEEEAEEEEKKPSALELLLANSKFSCSSKKDGYYADSSVNCQVFHYCVGGAKHSWMCPEGTVFHQVHLNCVPSAQDICSQSEKYHIVNEYLHKPIEQNYGPNQTIRYHQRYYPDEFLGDPLTPPNIATVQQYPAPAPNSRPNNAYSSRPIDNYVSSNTASYDDDNISSYRAASPSYSSNSNSAPLAAIRTSKPSYSNYPSGYSSQPKLSEPVYKPQAIVKPKPTYSSGGYPVSLITSPQPSRRPSHPPPSYSSNSDNYDDGSYKPTSYASSGSNYPSNSYQSQPSIRNQPINYSSSKPVSGYKPQAMSSYQPYSAASSPAYKPTVSTGNQYKAVVAKPVSNYGSNYPSFGSNSYSSSTNQARPSSGYEGNSKPYDYSGVTYEEDY